MLLPAENYLSEFAIRFIVLGEPYNGEPCRHDLAETLARIGLSEFVTPEEQPVSKRVCF